MKVTLLPTRPACWNRTRSQNTSSAILFTSSGFAAAAIAAAAVLFGTATTARAQETEVKKPTYSVLYTFTGGADGATPGAGALDFKLIRDTEGKIYGTTYGGDLASPAASCYGSGCGVIFKIKLPDDCWGDKK